MMKQYQVHVHVDGHYTTEDPKCPSYWRGSGCYDIDVKTWCDPVLDVWACSEDEARKFSEEYDYADGYTIEIDDIDIKKVEFIANLDRDEEESGVIDTIVEWKEYEED